MDMKVAIIGTGNVGRTLGSSLNARGHEVTFAAQDVDKTRAVAAELGTSAAERAVDAVAGADLTILAVPAGAVEAVAREIAGSVTGKVVIDASNPLTPDYSALAAPGGPSPAERVAAILGDAHVAKAFNTLFSSIQGDSDALGTQLDGFFATDDDSTRDTVAGLLASLGFRPVHIGGLVAARELEALAFLNIRLQMLAGGDWRSSFVLVGAPAGATAAPALAGSRAS